MSSIDLDHNHAEWRKLIVADFDDLIDDREAIECAILDSMPRTAADAVKILQVLRVNLEAGPRLDGRDLRAISAIEGWLEAWKGLP